ncbi:MAG: DUF4870 domain-containing protein [Planctomycetes bacterium]|nr:DUF4870 domain-containing protein [Planctomycetota bacterium]
MHVLALFTGFIGPLVIWLIKKDESEYIDQHGREALNFQISLLLCSLVATFLSIITCGVGAVLFLPLVLLLWVGCFIAAMQGYKGELCKYPLALQLLKQQS